MFIRYMTYIIDNALFCVIIYQQRKLKKARTSPLEQERKKEKKSPPQ